MVAEFPCNHIKVLKNFSELKNAVSATLKINEIENFLVLLSKSILSFFCNHFETFMISKNHTIDEKNVFFQSV